MKWRDKHRKMASGCRNQSGQLSSASSIEQSVKSTDCREKEREYNPGNSKLAAISPK